MLAGMAIAEGVRQPLAEFNFVILVPMFGGRVAMIDSRASVRAITTAASGDAT